MSHPDETDLRDARIAQVLRQAEDDAVMLVTATELDEPPAVVNAWGVRLTSRLRRDLGPDDAVRALEMVLTELAYQSAGTLIDTTFAVDPDDMDPEAGLS